MDTGELSVDEANARLKDLIRLTSDVVWEADRSLHLRGVSSTTLQQTGFLPHDLVGLPLLEIWQPENGVTLDSGKPFRDIKCILETPQGEFRYFLLSGLPVYNEDGDFHCMRGVAKDISPRMEAEHTLLESQVRLEQTIKDRTRDLEYANRSKSEFLANMSHELRTPLNAIIGFSELMGRELPGPLNDKQKEYLNDIEMSGNLLLSIINDVLDLSRIEAGKTALQEEVFALGSVIEDVIILLRNQAVDKQVSVVSEMITGIEVTADKRMCKQMLSNLLSNAVKFTEPGGKVRITAMTGSEGDLWLSVEDTGIGMSPTGIETAFQKFGQVNGDLNRLQTGTGLGLPLVAEQISLHGGSIETSSIIGEGTTQTLVFPAFRISVS